MNQSMGMEPRPQNRQALILEIMSSMKFALATTRTSGSGIADDASSISNETLRQLAEKTLDQNSTDP